MNITLNFKNLDQMTKWIDQLVIDKDDLGKVGVANSLEALIEYKTYFEDNIQDDYSLPLTYLGLKINDLQYFLTKRLIDFTLEDRIVFREIS